MNTGLKSVRILITAGPTRESWDTVRYITSRSSGKMGFALARKALEKGAEVTVVSCLAPPETGGIRIVPVESAVEMFEAVKNNFKRCDVFIAAGAVADFRPVRSEKKIVKSGEIPIIYLKKNPDILKWAGENRGRRLLVGFSLSDIQDINIARKKMIDKNSQIMVANSVGNMGSDRKTFTVISGETHSVYSDVPADEAALAILEKCADLLRTI